MSLELKTGVRLGDCELLTEVGRGGMASVWVARRRAADGDDRLVAVKVMLPKVAGNMEFRAMFLDEGRLAQSIDHSNVVRVYEVGEAAGTLYMAMEWIEGDSLREIIRRTKKRRPIPTEVAVRVVADIAAGLHAAHELRGWDGELRNLVHCDVSPHNILVGIDGSVKLVDFGVAHAATSVSELQTGHVRGKFGYMSPEQTRAYRLDRRSDVYSLGIVLYELTTGARLYDGEDEISTLELNRKGVFPRPSAVVPGYPPILEGVVLRALKPVADDRYATAEAMQRALEDYLRSERIVVPSAGVGRLAKRVLADDIERRRGEIRAALHGVNAGDADELVNDEPVLTHEERARPSMVGMSAVSLPQPSSPTAAPPSSGEHSVAPASSSQLDAPRSSSLTPSAPSGTPSAVSFSEAPSPPAPSRRKSGVPFALGWALGTLCGVIGTLAATALVSRGSEPQQQANDSAAAPQRAAETAASAPPRAAKRDDDALSIEALPVVDGAAPDGKSVEAEAAAEAVVRAGVQAPDKIAPETVVLHEAPEPLDIQLSEDHAGRAAGSNRSFNRSAAVSALGRAARSASACGRGKSGGGTVSVTFSSTGRVSGASVAGPFAGTEVGRCVAGVFYRVRVPAFSGSSVTLSRAFRVGG